MSSAHCRTAPPASVRMLETESRHFSRFTVLGVLRSTADVSVAPEHGSVHLGLGDFILTVILDPLIKIQWRYSPTGLWPTEQPPPVSEASANFCG